MGSLNLMSAQAQRHGCLWRRIRQWGHVLGVTAIILGIVTLERYWVYRVEMYRQLALEADYDPVEELKTANKLLTNQIAAIRREEEFVLALSDQEPTITLLGMIGKTVADADEHVFLQKIEVTNLGLAGGAPSVRQTVLDLAGVANSGLAVARFADALRGSVPFGKVEIPSTVERRIKTQAMQDFTLHANF